MKRRFKNYIAKHSVALTLLGLFSACFINEDYILENPVGILAYLIIPFALIAMGALGERVKRKTRESEEL